MSNHLHDDSGSKGLPQGVTATAGQLLDRWLGFWFKPTDLTTLGAIRICAGVLFTYILIIYSYNLQGYVGEDAWVNGDLMRKLRYEQPVWKESFGWYEPPDQKLPEDKAERAELNRYFAEWENDKRRMFTFGTPGWSIWYHVTDPRWIPVVHGFIILATVLFTVGFCTRVMSVVVWVASVSYVNRAVTSFFGMDTMMNLLLIYLMVGGVLGATGGALSVDRLLVRWWNRRSGGAASRKPDPPPSQLAQVGGNFALRLIQINFCIIYLASGLSKLQGSSWWNGNAMWNVSANPEFNPMGFWPYMSLLTFLAQHRWLCELAMNLGVLFTLGAEISFVYLIWLPKWRWIMIVAGVMLHTGIALQMGLVGFSLSMLTMLLAFVPPQTVRRMANLLMDQVRPFLELVMRVPVDSKERMAMSR